MASIEESLRALRDVQGVFGSFVVAASGALVSQDLPGVYDADLLAELGPRLIRLYETFASGGEELESAMVRYAEHKLYVRKMTWGLLGVITGVEVNLPALRMVGNLVVRRIDPEVAVLTPASAPPPRVAAAVAQPPAPPPAPALAPLLDVPEPAHPQHPDDTHVRMYRGRRVVS